MARAFSGLMVVGLDVDEIRETGWVSSITKEGHTCHEVYHRVGRVLRDEFRQPA